MMNKHYDVLLDNKKIGITYLEKADPPMGVVFGQLYFTHIYSGYDFFKQYCLTHQIEITDYPAEKGISTRQILNLQVFNTKGNEIKGMACSIDGMDSDEFQITIIGISYPFYEEEFPHHVQTYNGLFGM
jgi:hypothetical protein